MVRSRLGLLGKPSEQLTTPSRHSRSRSVKSLKGNSYFPDLACLFFILQRTPAVQIPKQHQIKAQAQYPMGHLHPGRWLIATCPNSSIIMSKAATQHFSHTLSFLVIGSESCVMASKHTSTALCSGPGQSHWLLLRLECRAQGPGSDSTQSSGVRSEFNSVLRFSLLPSNDYDTPLFLNQHY